MKVDGKRHIITFYQKHPDIGTYTSVTNEALAEKLREMGYEEIKLPEVSGSKSVGLASRDVRLLEYEETISMLYQQLKTARALLSKYMYLLRKQIPPVPIKELEKYEEHVENFLSGIGKYSEFVEKVEQEFGIRLPKKAVYSKSEFKRVLAEMFWRREQLENLMAKAEKNADMLHELDTFLEEFDERSRGNLDSGENSVSPAGDSPESGAAAGND